MTLVLYVLAFVLFVLAGLGVGHPRAVLGWLGLAALTLTLLLPSLQ